MIMFLVNYSDLKVQAPMPDASQMKPGQASHTAAGPELRVSGFRV